MTFKDAILQLHERIGELSQAAAMLENKNLADIITSGAAKLMQASEHPDVGAVDALAEAEHAKSEPRMPFNPGTAQQ